MSGAGSNDHTPPSPSSAGRIEDARGRFEAAWSAGEQLRIAEAARDGSQGGEASGALPPKFDPRSTVARHERGAAETHAPARISRMRRPTIASSPGCIIHTPIVRGYRAPGGTSMLGSPSRSFLTISGPLTRRA
jgi:hypothetical protein